VTRHLPHFPEAIDDEPSPPREAPRPPSPEAVLAALPATIGAVAAVLGVSEGAARWAVLALYREGRVEVAARVVEGRRVVAVWRGR
jgi:hypothetical protein